MKNTTYGTIKPFKYRLLCDGIIIADNFKRELDAWLYLDDCEDMIPGYPTFIVEPY